MDVMRVHLPDDLERAIDRQIAEGRASSKADFLAEAARLHADHLDAQDELAKMAERADADVAAGRFAVIGRMSQLSL
jgi:Arc/MetJ-type ribon-helix-helix transcriptional regulator